jgi:hypothetical protein
VADIVIPLQGRLKTPARQISLENAALAQSFRNATSTEAMALIPSFKRLPSDGTMVSTDKTSPVI